MILRAIVVAALVATGCAKSKPAFTGTITADGSSTVAPLTTAITRSFAKTNPGVQFTIAASGTTSGFARFCRAEVDLQNASRPINAIERQACERAGVQFVEIPVAFDALTIIAHPSNTWATTLTLPELKKLWEPGAEKSVTRWGELRAGWPSEPIALFGPNSDSGTFDFFTEVVVGSLRASRKDYTASEDHDAIAKAVAANPNALGYLGFTHYASNRSALKAVPIAGPNAERLGPLAPTVENVQRGAYQPLSRTLLVYANVANLERPELAEFVSFYLKQDEDLIRQVAGIPMTARAYELVRQRVAKRIPGTIFQDGREPGNLELTLAAATK